MKANYNPADTAAIAASLQRSAESAALEALRRGDDFHEAFSGKNLDGAAVRRCLIAIGAVKPNPRWQDDPSPGPAFMPEGAVMRKRQGKGKAAVTAVSRVPATLRMDHWGKLEAAKPHAPPPWLRRRDSRGDKERN